MTDSQSGKGKDKNGKHEVVHKKLSEKQRGSAVPMTAEQMQNAQPLPLPEVDKGSKRRNRTRERQRAGNVGAAVKPDILKDYMPSRPSRSRAEPAATIDGGYSYPAPYTVFQVPPGDRLRTPYRSVGKLFMNFGGNSFVGSAAIIDGDYILTAGHCVHDRSGGWADSFTFVPAFDSNSSPLGQWTGVDAWALKAWTEDENFELDIAVVKLQANDEGSVGDVCGTLGVIFDLNPVQHWHACGYPSGAPYDGMELVGTSASYAYDADPQTPESPIGIGCDMTPGCSGGPWIWRFDFDSNGSSNLINGVNSFRWSGNDEEMFSPRFGPAVKGFDRISVGWVRDRVDARKLIVALPSRAVSLHCDRTMRAAAR